MTTTASDKRQRPAATPSAGRLFAAPGPSLVEHLSTFGPLPERPSGHDDLASLLESSGLLGRGGAGFPSARKLRAVARYGGGVVVANGSEGEPASDKDRTLLTTSPHLVLDGLVLAARAVGAREAFLATARPDVAAVAREAVAARTGRQRERFSIGVVEVPDRFVTGQESALVNAINGRPALPSDRLVPVYRRGVHRRPTLVHNVETLAHMALIARNGASWFRAVGTSDEPGTFLATVSGEVSAPGVSEVAFGAPLGELIGRAGGSAEVTQAVLVGGFHGAWVPGLEVTATRMSNASLGAHGAAVGAGVVAVLGRGRCGLVESAAVATYLADQGAGQCGPCVNGLPRMAAVLQRLAARERIPRLVDEVTRMSRLVAGRGACAHPDGTARFVTSTMRVFADEVAVHLGGGCSVEVAR